MRRNEHIFKGSIVDDVFGKNVSSLFYEGVYFLEAKACLAEAFLALEHLSQANPQIMEQKAKMMQTKTQFP